MITSILDFIIQTCNQKYLTPHSLKVKNLLSKSILITLELLTNYSTCSNCCTLDIPIIIGDILFPQQFHKKYND